MTAKRNYNCRTLFDRNWETSVFGRLVRLVECSLVKYKICFFLFFNKSALTACAERNWMNCANLTDG